MQFHFNASNPSPAPMAHDQEQILHGRNGPSFNAYKEEDALFFCINYR